jgi:hypothetical protein
MSKNYDDKTHAFTKDVEFFRSPELSYNIEPAFQFCTTPNTSVVRDSEHNTMVDYETSKKNKKDIVYKLNNFCHISEDFVLADPQKTNILFAGCSVTAGEYLPHGYSWPHHLYSYIKETNSNLGPQQILSFPGANASKIIANIFKYVNLFGKPDYIFLMLPDMFRLYTAYEDNFRPEITYAEGATIDDLMFPFQGMYEYQMAYRNLEIFCSSLGIKLFSTSWEMCANAEMGKLNFKTYRSLSFSSLKTISTTSAIGNLSEEKYKDFKKKYYIYGSDKLHPGLISHINYTNHFIERLKNDI